MKSGSLGELKGALEEEGIDDYSKSFRSQVELYKNTALSAWHESAPSEKERQEGSMKSFRDGLREILEAELSDFCKEDFGEPGERFHRRVASLATFMYIYDKMLELHAAVMRKDKMGLYSLFDTTRNAYFALLSKSYFQRDFSDVMADYLGDEPLLMACSELAEVELVPVQGVVQLYQPMLAKLVVARLKKEEKAAGGDKPAEGEQNTVAQDASAPKARTKSAKKGGKEKKS